MTKEDYGDWDEVLANIPQPSMDEYASQIDWNSPASDLSQNPQSNETAPPLFQPLPDNASRATPRSADWQSKELAKRRQILLVGTIGILSSILAGAGFIAFLQYMNSAPPKIAEVSDAISKKNDQPSPADSNRPPEPSDQGTKTTEPPTNPNEQPGKASKEPEALPPDTNVPPPNSLPPEGASTETIPPLPDNVVPRDPLTNANPNSAPNWNQKGGSEESDTNLDDKLNELFGDSRIGKILKPDTLPRESFGKQLSLDELDIEKLDEPPTQIFHPMPKSLPSWSERADGLRIARLAIKETSLPRCIDMFSRLTGVGITIDWEQCAAFGIDFEQKLTFDVQDQTVGKILNDVLTPIGLRLEVDNEGFAIIRPIPISMPDNEAIGETWDLTSIGLTTQPAAFADLLITLWELNSIAETVDGKIHWKPNASAKDKANVWSTLTHLKMIQKETAAPWPGKTPAPQVLFGPEAWKAGRGFFDRQVPATIATGEPRSISEILQHTALETQSNLVIDWKNAWKHGLTPSQFAISVMRNRTLPQIGERFLNDYALEFVPIHEKTVWLTTSEVRRQRVCVLPVQLHAEQSLEETKRALRSLAPTDSDGRSKFKFTLVPGTKDLYLVRVCMPKLQQVIEPDLEFGFQW